MVSRRKSVSCDSVKRGVNMARWKGNESNVSKSNKTHQLLLLMLMVSVSRQPASIRSRLSVA